ncbi:type VII secretion-associated protein [Mycobacterium sp. E740]|nr:type VII secretion-associated protein [Mycobacterium sp. E740]
MVSVALEAIDDELALLDERPVSVPELWTALLRDAAAAADAIILVYPTGWPSARIDRLRTAAQQVATVVEVIGRTEALQAETRATVVEVAPELLVVTRVGARAVVVSNLGPDVGDKVAAAVGVAGPVLVDAPTSMQADHLVSGILKQLRAKGVSARIIEDDAVRRGAARLASPDDEITGPHRDKRRAAAVRFGAVAVTATVCGALGFRVAADPPDSAARVLVEGRVEVMVPAAWPVQRITSGPGSARLEITSPSDDVSLHLTQSVGGPQTDLAQTAAALRTALADEPGDVFVEFDASGARAGRSAVTYRELRADHHVAWTVLVDDGVRIAIGCQSAPGRESSVREVCDRVISSAHAVS